MLPNYLEKSNPGLNLTVRMDSAGYQQGVRSYGDGRSHEEELSV